MDRYTTKHLKSNLTNSYFTFNSLKDEFIKSLGVNLLNN